MPASKRLKYFDGTVFAEGSVICTDLQLTQTLGGTDTTTWKTAGAPAIITGGMYMTFSNGKSTFRVPCWPTT
jgi:hypothetical protein